MSLPEGAYISKEGWIVYRSEAFLPEEWERSKPKRPYRRLTDEERRTYKRDWQRRWREANPDRALAASRRAYAHQRGAARVLHAVASLHSLACSGPTQKTGCRCQKVVLWREEAL